MKKQIEIDAVALVRDIRDKQAALLQGKSDKEIIAYFRKAGASDLERPSQRGSAGNAKDK
jgi:hypothetical protein